MGAGLFVGGWCVHTCRVSPISDSVGAATRRPRPEDVRWSVGCVEELIGEGQGLRRMCTVFTKPAAAVHTR